MISQDFRKLLIEALRVSRGMGLIGAKCVRVMVELEDGKEDCAARFNRHASEAGVWVFQANLNWKGRVAE